MSLIRLPQHGTDWRLADVRIESDQLRRPKPEADRGNRGDCFAHAKIGPKAGRATEQRMNSHLLDASYKEVPLLNGQQKEPGAGYRVLWPDEGIALDRALARSRI
jgi:hypothetical protein